MTTELITAIAWIVIRGLQAGMTMADLYKEMKDTGEMTDEMWTDIIEALEQADQGFRNAPGPE